jgi:hypothetical protein
VDRHRANLAIQHAVHVTGWVPINVSTVLLATISQTDTADMSAPIAHIQTVLVQNV